MNKLDELLADFSMVATYLPQDLGQIEDSRGVFKRSDLSEQMLKYRVAISYKGRLVIETDYRMGIGHIPGFKEPRVWTVPIWNAMKWVFRGGKAPPAGVWTHDSGRSGLLVGKPILPTLKDVMYCLCMDSNVLDYSSFEAWAADFDYDTDSRKAEGVYRACLATALGLRAGIGSELLGGLQEAFQDY